MSFRLHREQRNLHGARREVYLHGSQADADVGAQADIDKYGQAYANAQGTCLFYSVYKSDTFTKQYCPTGQVGACITYAVEAGKYTSSLSQNDADTKAQDDVRANGQDYANSKGGCYHLTPASTQVLFTHDGGFQTIQVDANLAWTAQFFDPVDDPNVGWLKVFTKGQQLRLVCSYNGGVSRSGTVILTGTAAGVKVHKAVEIEQVGGDASLVAPTQIDIAADMLTSFYEINSKRPWEISDVFGDFFVAEKVDESTLKITTQMDEKGRQREGSITLNNGDKSVTIIIVKYPREDVFQ